MYIENYVRQHNYFSGVVAISIYLRRYKQDFHVPYINIYQCLNFLYYLD